MKRKTGRLGPIRSTLSSEPEQNIEPPTVPLWRNRLTYAIPILAFIVGKLFLSLSKTDQTVEENKRRQEVFVVFLNRSKEVKRRNDMTQQLDALGLSYSRFPAIDIDNQGSDELLTRTLRACGQRLFSKADGYIWREATIGELGCTLSHLSILQKLAVEVDPSLYPMALIIEDDAKLSPLRVWPMAVELLSESSGNTHQPLPNSGTMNSLLLDWLRAIVPLQWNIINMSPIQVKISDVPPIFTPWSTHHYGSVGYLVNLEGNWLSELRETDWPLMLQSKYICRVADELIYELLGGESNLQQAYTSNIPLVLHGELDDISDSTIRDGKPPFVVAARRSQDESWKRLFTKWFRTAGTSIVPVAITTTSAATTRAKTLSISKPPGSNSCTMAVLILEHDGVYSHRIWEEWEKLNQGAACVFVHHDGSKPLHRDIAGLDYIRPRRLGTSMPTPWASPNMVEATARSMCEILSLEPNAQEILIASGSEVPVRKLQAAMDKNPETKPPTSPSVSRISLMYPNDEASSDPFKQVLRQKNALQRKLDPEFIESLVFAHASLSLTRRHVAAICRSLEEYVRIADIVHEFLVGHETYDNGLISLDELFPASWLRYQERAAPESLRPDKLSTIATTMVFFSQRGDLHPVTWTEMDKAERHTLRDAPQSLRDLLDVLAVNVPKGYSTKVLLRKVKMISAEEHDKLLDYLENKLWVL
jgi:hypothetical protein